MQLYLAQVTTCDIYAISLAKELDYFLGDLLEHVTSIISGLAHPIQDYHSLVDLVAGAVVLWNGEMGGVHHVPGWAFWHRRLGPSTGAEVSHTSQGLVLL